MSITTLDTKFNARTRNAGNLEDNNVDNLSRVSLRSYDGYVRPRVSKPFHDDDENDKELVGAPPLPKSKSKRSGKERQENGNQKSRGGSNEDKRENEEDEAARRERRRQRRELKKLKEAANSIGKHTNNINDD